MPKGVVISKVIPDERQRQASAREFRLLLCVVVRIVVPHTHIVAITLNLIELLMKTHIYVVVVVVLRIFP